MDIVTDLTARAVSYISLIQDLHYEYSNNLIGDRKYPIILGDLSEYLKFPPVIANEDNLKNNITRLNYLDGLLKNRNPKGTKSDYLNHIIEVVRIGNDNIAKETALEMFSESSRALLTWLKNIKNRNIVKESIESCTYPSPCQWRDAIRNILYLTDDRLELANALHYLPIQIVLALGGGNSSAYTQRLYQVGFDDAWNEKYFSKYEKEKTRKFWNEEAKKEAKILLNDDQKLFASLTGNSVQAPLPFETIFNEELDEIESRRKKRSIDESGEKNKIRTKNIDAFKRSKSLDLTGLCFSGGGIRSATFNLGVLQSLATNKKLNKFDYLSTVSGGGYIGSWLVAWIKRDGSLSKVTDRLNPEKSSDPLAEEVRPIRWLRMYSNYLAPDKSIMSTDSWTMGFTWLRNTLINQFVLLLLLCASLSALPLVMHLWLSSKWFLTTPAWEVNLYSGVILLIGAILTGAGMHVYNDDPPPLKLVKLESSNVLSTAIIYWALISTFFISAWLYTSTTFCYSIEQKLSLMVMPFIEANFAMFLIFIFGRYYLCKPNRHKVLSLAANIFCSIISLAIGFFLLIWVWVLLEKLHYHSAPSFFQENHEKIAFVIGVPSILEAIAITVVVKMALLGNLFLDERREWWGRIGAKVHRIAFFWLLATSTLLILDIFNFTWDFILNRKFIAVFGGWSAIIGYCVKLAFGPQTSGLDKEKTKGGINISEILISIAPYIFGLGSVLLGVLLLKFIDHYYYSLLTIFKNHFPYYGEKVNKLKEWVIFFFFAMMTGITSWRVGVNEFSLHHFYCNRLVRAYLGATRRRTERIKTANPFTGFDSNDDIKLADFITANDYDGPYPIINTALNTSVVSTLDRQDRKAESFIFSPLFCGFDVSATRSEASSNQKTFDYGYRKTNEYAIQPEGPCIGTAMAISGAAINPNMGYHSSPAIAFLLTVFNLRLGWWMGNPRRNTYKRSDPKLGLIYLINDLIGKSDTKNEYVCLSDGGHFDNMGIYELVRRRCSTIILSDAEEDPKFICEGFANAIKRCRIDFGVEITINIDPIINRKPTTGFSPDHIVEGTIWYPGDSKNKPTGRIIYLKSSLTGKESVDIRQYHLENPIFPHQSTNDQFFDESQFESYRKLGIESAENLKKYL